MKIKMLFIILMAVLAAGCEENIVELPKLCTEEPEISYSNFQLSILTDDTCTVQVNIDQRGLFFAENIIINRNNISKSANIAGYICRDTRFYVSVTYNDTANTSKLKIEGGPLTGNAIPGKIFYCPNENSICNFVQIGNISGSYSGNIGIGVFFSPLFSGQFSFVYLLNDNNLLPEVVNE